MKALQELSDRIHQAPTLDCLLDAILETLEDLFGFRHSMILLASERPDRLETDRQPRLSRGRRGFGGGLRRGIIGMVAEARKPIRISGMMRQMLYAYAVAERARSTAWSRTRGASRCRAWPTPKASSASRCWCATS